MKSLFDFKLRLLGYYSSSDQKMNPEEAYVSEAEELSSLLHASLVSLVNNELTDDDIKEAILGTTVFIFKDNKNKLYAYFSGTGIARITNVSYSKKDIREVPLKYKRWFLPGDEIRLIDESSQLHENEVSDSHSSIVGRQPLFNEINEYALKIIVNLDPTDDVELLLFLLALGFARSRRLITQTKLKDVLLHVVKYHNNLYSGLMVEPSTDCEDATDVTIVVMNHSFKFRNLFLGEDRSNYDRYRKITETDSIQTWVTSRNVESILVNLSKMSKLSFLD